MIRSIADSSREKQMQKVMTMSVYTANKDPCWQKSLCSGILFSIEMTKILLFNKDALK